jgi:hypothetical protein
MDNSRFTVTAPWQIDDQTEIILAVLNTSLLGSRRHFLVFDLYPEHAPSHPERHLECWELPKKHAKAPRRMWLW